MNIYLGGLEIFLNYLIAERQELENFFLYTKNELWVFDDVETISISKVSLVRGIKKLYRRFKHLTSAFVKTLPVSIFP